ncbi:MAG: desulfoferrodoxin [Candidatus Micrarchaeota archaeon]|nr:desulfoferrodoxin [Candidatus Micrarchaeota archaeon]
MAKQNEIYKCSVCGNIVEVLHPGEGKLVCCGLPMDLQKEKSQDAGGEKHVPVIEKIANGVKVRIGSIPHPMEASHYIEWIQVFADGKAYRKFLKPGDKPEAEFEIKADKITAREYCNVHGLWIKA